MTTVGITGHQIIPEEAKDFVERELRAQVRRLGPKVVGYSSLASGADQVFAEIVLEQGGRLYAVIPSRRYERSFGDANARRRFRSLLRLAWKVEQLDHRKPTEDAYLDAGQWVVQASDILLAIWDGEAAKGRGGTADIVRYARECGKDVEVIWPKGVKR